MLGPVSLPRVSLNLGVILGIPDTLTAGFELKGGDSGEGVRTRDFALDGTISGSRGPSGTG